MNGQTDTYLKDFSIYEDVILTNILFMKNYQKNFGNFILNLDFANRGGTHWVALIHTLDNKYKECYYYFDSFGFKPPEEFKQLIGNIPCYYSNTQFQQISKSDCGIWCLLFLKLAGYFQKLSLKDFDNIIDIIKELEIKWT